MRFGFSWTLGTTVLALVAGWMALESTASACQPDPCASTPQWLEFELVHDTVATDGILVFRARQGQGGADEAAATMPYVTLEVADEQGMPVAGALEYETFLGTMVWRPDAPFSPNADYTVTLAVDNDTIDTELWENFDNFMCAENIAAQWTVSTTAGALTPPSLPVFEGTAQVEATVDREVLEDLVCCDGAMPREEFTCLDTGGVVWDEGFCEGTMQLRRLRVTFEIDWSALSAERSANLAVALVTDGPIARGEPGTTSLTFSALEPVCATLEVYDLVTGDVVDSRPQCFGEQRVPLGWVDYDPTDSLMQACAGQPYVCETLPDDSTRWDPDNCQPWGDGGDGDGGSTTSGGDGGDGTGSGGDDGGTSGGTDGGGSDGGDDAGQDGGIADRGCGCASTPAGRPMPWLLALMGLGWLRRRRG